MRQIHKGILAALVCCLGFAIGMTIWYLTDRAHQLKPKPKLIPENVEWLPERELRGVWMATVKNIDWPSTPGLSTQEQQQQLISALDKMVQLNMNALFFQVRPVGDAFYASGIEPWSMYLTGHQGRAPKPFYDPLRFIIDEAHKRNIELHAWFNPYRANMSPNTKGLANNHMAFKFPNYTYAYGNFLWMDPGREEVAEHCLQVIVDVLKRYNVDGIHMDDYFYPYPVANVSFPDDDTYHEYRNTTKQTQPLNKSDWRRENVNVMVLSIYNYIRTNNGSVKFSISPFGIYRAGEPDGQPSSIKGFDQYSQLYADPKLWLLRGWVDIMIPQLYWEIEPPQQSYPVLLDWWLNVSTQYPLARHVYAGNACYKLIERNWTASEIGNQIDVSRRMSRQYQIPAGNIHFSLKHLMGNSKGISDMLHQGHYNSPCLPPSFMYLSTETPNPPAGIHMMSNRMIMWNRDQTVRSWTVYKRHGDTMNLIVVLQKSKVTYTVSDAGVYAVRSVNKMAIESTPVAIEVK